ncbi:MAG: permease [Candidatus Margulisiibacteriota bacterium]|nr:MAG: permease [Candidatus Margulisiibacteriota bacterium]HAR63000.1 hypothetical protein [Candidatus Margulisiibacteriota bacterium]HCT83725.1 hypothetical protein [Candidatus Margulisiibacteriota bacterium]HCY36963.1 hypothetical protein [Candidatus Margulisiibacteriota bacterium]
MGPMTNLLTTIATETWNIFMESAPFVLLGIALSGILHLFISKQFILTHLGKSKIKSVFLAALIGVPLPLCSCGVIPMAISLRKRGATKGATSAFLISTPESGIDSMLISYALLDPILTIARPVIAFITAITAGILSNLIPEKAQLAPETSSCEGACCSDHTEHPTHHTRNLKLLVKKAIHFILFDLLHDMGRWLILGIILAGIISVLIPKSFFAFAGENPLITMPLMVVIGIPMYICASSSTPIAAALILKGISPGAALVFLLTGPATNITTITMITRFLGKKLTGIYLTTIIICALVFGMLIDMIYVWLKINPQAIVGTYSHSIPDQTNIIFALILIFLIVISFSKKATKYLPGLATE